MEFLKNINKSFKQTTMSTDNWINVKDELPEINHSDKYDSEHKISVRVIVFVDGYNVSFGKYYYNEHCPHWSVEGLLGFDQSKVKYWIPLPSPPNQ